MQKSLPTCGNVKSEETRTGMDDREGGGGLGPLDELQKHIDSPPGTQKSTLWTRSDRIDRPFEGRDTPWWNLKYFLKFTFGKSFRSFNHEKRGRGNEGRVISCKSGLNPSPAREIR